MWTNGNSSTMCVGPHFRNAQRSTSFLCLLLLIWKCANVNAAKIVTQACCTLLRIFKTHGKACVFLWFAVHLETSRCKLMVTQAQHTVAACFWKTWHSVHFLEGCDAFGKQTAMYFALPFIYICTFPNAGQSTCFLCWLLCVQKHVNGNTDMTHIAAQFWYAWQNVFFYCRLPCTQKCTDTNKW